MKKISILLAAIFVVAFLLGFTPSVNSFDECDSNDPCYPEGPGLECGTYYCCVNPHAACTEQGKPVYRVTHGYLDGTNCTDDCFILKFCVANCDPV